MSETMTPQEAAWLAFEAGPEPDMQANIRITPEAPAPVDLGPDGSLVKIVAMSDKDGYPVVRALSKSFNKYHRYMDIVQRIEE
jgi:hypothetical protein